MNRLTRNIFFALIASGVMFTSCKNDDTERSVITSFEKFTFTELPEAIEVPEEDNDYDFTFKFDERQLMNVNVGISVNANSTATEGVDFDLSTHSIAIGAFGQEGSFSITVYGDFEPEEDETVILDLYSEDLHGLPLPAETLVMTIKNSVGVIIELDWDGLFDYAGNTYDLCSNVDIDFYLTDADGNVVDGYQGATGACPEYSYMDGIADGEYDIMANLYDNGLFGAPDIDTVAIPMRVNLFKGGEMLPSESTVRYDTGDFSEVPLWTAYTEPDPTVNIGKIRIGGGKVTLVDPAGTEVGSVSQ